MARVWTASLAVLEQLLYATRQMIDEAAAATDLWLRLLACTVCAVLRM